MGGDLFGLGGCPGRAPGSWRPGCAYLDAKLGRQRRIPRCYSNKADFGDVDVLASSLALGERSWAQPKAESVLDLGVQQHESAKRLLSTVYRGSQVDLFLVSGEDRPSTCHVTSSSDPGSIIGWSVRRLGLKPEPGAIQRAVLGAWERRCRGRVAAGV